MQQAIKINDLDQLVANQQLRAQLANREHARQSTTSLVRRLVNLLTTQGMGVTMNGSLYQCLHCGRTGQEEIPVYCKHCQKSSQGRS